MKIAIVRLSALGDIVHSMVILQFIKKNYPNSLIDWVVDDRFKGILENNPHINQIHTLKLNEAKKQRSFKLFFRELLRVRQFGQYDLVIDTQGLLKSAIVSKFLNGIKIVGFDKNSIRERAASYFYNQKITIGYQENTILRNLSLICGSLGINVSHNEIINKNSFLFSKSKILIPKASYIVFIIGSTWESRNYPKEKFVEVAELISKVCLVVWGNEQEKEKADWMSAESAFIQVMPRLELDDLKHVLDKATLVIGNDTGPTHIAWGLNTPSITLFGPTPVDRIYEAPNHKAIKSSSSVDHSKLNMNDFSIKDIDPNEIAKMAFLIFKNNK